MRRFLLLALCISGFAFARLSAHAHERGTDAATEQPGEPSPRE
jgi:hypothetical protein